MPADVKHYKASDVSVELEQRPSKALRKFGNARLTISLGTVPVWITHRPSGSHGIDWTWSDLLSFFTSNWTWLLNEQGMPLPLNYSPKTFAGTAADMWSELSQKNGIVFTKEQKRILRAFCQRHDLAQAAPGIVLPSLFLVRVGNQMLFSSENKQVLIDIQDAYHLLSQVGDTIHDWMAPYADDGTQPLLDAWKTRDQRVRMTITQKEHLLVRMNKADFDALSAEMSHTWGNTWDGPILRESEIFAAARMSAGLVSVAQQMDILHAIKSCPATNTEQIDSISRCLRNSSLSLSKFDENNLPHNQGYALANKFCTCLHQEAGTPLDPQEILTEFGVRIQEMEWHDSPLDALSCWSDAHGPLILLNVAAGKRCSHPYGYRFTLAHELCHLVVDRGHSLSVVDVLGRGMPDFLERRANAFAAEILLPRDLAAQEFRKNSDTPSKLLERLRVQYNVPHKTAASQIYNSSASSEMSQDERKFFNDALRERQHDEPETD